MLEQLEKLNVSHNRIAEVRHSDSHSHTLTLTLSLSLSLSIYLNFSLTSSITHKHVHFHTFTFPLGPSILEAADIFDISGLVRESHYLSSDRSVGTEPTGAAYLIFHPALSLSFPSLTPLSLRLSTSLFFPPSLSHSHSLDFSLLPSLFLLSLSFDHFISRLLSSKEIRLKVRQKTNELSNFFQNLFFCFLPRSVSYSLSLYLA